MSPIKLFIVLAFVVLSLKAEAQIYKLLNLTEQQVRKKLRNKYPVIIRRYSTHEFVTGLIFKNKREEIKVVCLFYFNMDKCGSVSTYEDSKKRKRNQKLFDKKFNIISENKWRSKDNTFEVGMRELKVDMLIITYTRGISDF